MKLWQCWLLTIMVWNALGFVLGTAATVIERDSHHYESDDKGHFKSIDDGRTGCIYRSYSAFTNPGYVAACEMFRKRFEIESLEKALK